MKLSMKNQQGITLFEAIIAMVVSALGILGVLGMQMRTLSDASTNVRRAQAIRLIDDLSERLAVNHNSWSVLDRYQADWGAVPPWMVIQDCAAISCKHYELAEWDMVQWKNSVAAWLPAGDAKVFITQDEEPGSYRPNRRQLGVMVAWRENELLSERKDGQQKYREYKSPIDMAKGSGAVAECPEGKVCHLQFISVLGRCLPLENRRGELQCAHVEY